MNELIQAVGGPEVFPYVMGALALVIALGGSYWLTRSGKPIDSDDERDVDVDVACQA